MRQRAAKEWNRGAIFVFSLRLCGFASDFFKFEPTRFSFRNPPNLPSPEPSPKASATHVNFIFSNPLNSLPAFFARARTPAPASW
jgi:hypothetical protein